MVRTYAALPGKNLLEAIDLANETFGIEKEPEAKQEKVAAQNAASIQRLNQMMTGLR